MNKTRKHPLIGTPAVDRHGLSTIELISVIAIIGVLMVLLIPVIRIVRERMDRTECASNLRMTGHAIHLYAVDNEGRLPYIVQGSQQETILRHWRRSILPYVGMRQEGDDVWNTPFRCPVVSQRVESSGHRGGIPSYGMNTRLENIPLASVRDPSRTLMATESSLDSNGIPSPQINPGVVQRDGLNYHGTGQNILYVDGHVDFFEDIARLSQSPYKVNGESDVWTP